MEKRKWLWKRKSSEKSPGETESSESLSSHSERNYDDQEALKASPNHDIQSPEVTSRAAVNGEEVNDRLKNLTEKLSAALLNVSAKDDLVKQHSKVAEEAVAGWEKAENEVVGLKQQLEAAVQKNSALEDRVSHLDGALKECVRQLRQAREEQEKIIHEAVVKKTQDWESTKSELESQILELQAQVEASKAVSTATADPDICHKLNLLERENSGLKVELLSQFEELEITTIERDLSTQAAETASKQHLESIKKVAKLEAECRRLKAVARKSSSVNDHKSVAASSYYVESLTDSQSDSGERLNAVDMDNTRKMSTVETIECDPSCSDSWASALIAELDQFKNEKTARNFTATAVEIDLMDDFLEMERLAALPQTESKRRSLESEAVSNQSVNGENPLKVELEAMHHRTTELEEKLEEMKSEKAELEEKLENMEGEKAELEEKLENMEGEKAELERKLENMEEEKDDLEGKLEIMEEEKEKLEEKLENMEAEKTELEDKLDKMEAERAELEDKLDRMEAERAELEDKLDKMEAEKAELEDKLDKMEAERAELEDKLDKIEAERAELETALRDSQDSNKSSQVQLREAEMKSQELQRQLAMANEKKQILESQLIGIEVESRTMSAKVDSLEAEIEMERALSLENSVKCKELEDELSRKKQESELHQNGSSNGEMKIKQEDLVVAAEKLVECQQTIASLGKQLKSLATLEDFLIDTTNLPETSGGGGGGGGSLLARTAGGEVWKLHSNDTFLPKKVADSSNIDGHNAGASLINGNSDENSPHTSSSSSTSSSNNASSEKSRNGFVKLFSRSKGGGSSSSSSSIQLENQ